MNGMNGKVTQHMKIARTLVNSTLDGIESGTYTRDDMAMMVRGAMGDLGFALAILLGAPATIDTQLAVARATEAAVKVVVEVETNEKLQKNMELARITRETKKGVTA